MRLKLTYASKRSFLASLILSFLLAFTTANANDLPTQLKGHGGPIKSISISPDGERVLTASFDYSIIHWDITGAEARILHRLEGHDAAVNDAIFLPGRKKAVSVSDDGTLGIWDLEAGTLIQRIDAPQDKVLDIAVSSDGKLAAVARWDETVRLYDLDLQLELAVLKGHRGNVNSVVFSRDDRFLYSASYDGQILEWDVETFRMLRPVYRHGWGINTLALLKDDRLMFGGLDGTVAAVDIEQAERVVDFAKRERPIQSVKVSKDGALAAFGDGTGQIQVFAADSGKQIETAEVTYGPVWDFDFVSGTNQIYHVGLDDFATRWQISPRKLNQNQAELPRRFQVRDSSDPGELEFQRKCSVCHTLVEDGANRAGPTLFKVFGRKAGTLPGYKYSKALLDSDIIWNEETIGLLFDEGPDKIVPGTKMPIQRLKQIERREDLIRFLKTATQPTE
ncbi:MAG: cytochrome C [Rhizobiaceae bacterium]|nr:cytochrome C [Rhizobiaceae bacterium]